MAERGTLFTAHAESAQRLLGGLAEDDSWADTCSTLACSARTLAAAAKGVTWLATAQVLVAICCNFLPCVCS